MMWMRTVMLGLGLVVISAVSAEDKKEEKKPLDPKAILGEWVIIEGMKAGEKSGDDVKKTAIKINDKTIELKADGAEFEFSYKLDAKKTPADIDLEIIKPDAFKGSKAPGIIKLEDEKLTLCYPPMGGDRPKEFKSTKDNGNYLFVMKKKK